MNVSKARLKVRSQGAVSGPSKPEADFDDLENWEDAPAGPDIVELPPDEIPVINEVANSARISRGNSGSNSCGNRASGSRGSRRVFPARPENATPISLRPHLGLTKIERIGLVSLLVILLLGAAAVYVYSLNRLPSESVKAEVTDFPIKGDQISIDSATSYLARTGYGRAESGQVPAAGPNSCRCSNSR